MKLVSGGVTLEVTGKTIKAGSVDMSPSEVERASELLSLARKMTSLPVLMPVKDNVFEIRFKGNKTFDFVRLGTSTTVESVYPDVSFDDFDNLITGLRNAIKTHIDMSKLGGDTRTHRQTEYLSDDPGIG